MVASRLTVLSVILALWGCGAAGGPHGGGENLPSTGSHGFTIDEDFRLSQAGVDLRSPSVILSGETKRWMYLIEDDGERSRAVRYEMTASSVEMDDILRTELQLEGKPWEDDDLVFLEVQTTEEGYQAVFLRQGADVVEWALSDNGTDWSLRDQSIPLPGDTLKGLTLGKKGNDWLIWALSEESLWMGELDSDNEWEWTDIGLPTGLPFGEEEIGLWEKNGMSSLQVLTEVTPTGRPQYRMWYGGIRIAVSGILDGGIGFAASWDGMHWERSPNGATLYNAGFGEKEPFVLEGPNQDTLYYSRFWKKEGSNRHVIGRALRNGIE